MERKDLEAEATVELEKPFSSVEEIKDLLSAAPGVEVVDDVVSFKYPMPLTAAGRDPVPSRS